MHLLLHSYFLIMLPTSCVRSGEIPVIENDQQAEEPSTLDDTVNPLKQPVSATVRNDDVLETAQSLVCIAS